MSKAFNSQAALAPTDTIAAWLSGQASPPQVKPASARPLPSTQRMTTHRASSQRTVSRAPLRSVPLRGVTPSIAPVADTKYIHGQNHLLASLPAEDYQRLAPALELVSLEPGQVLYEAGERSKYVYFPTTSIVSLSYELADGATAEVAVVGNEGVVGFSLFMGGETTPCRAFVQNGGSAYRLGAQTLMTEFDKGGPILRLLLRYMQALIAQMTQTAVCNRYHSVEQQLCRRLLISLDRLPTSLLTMTQESIARLLGVRREGITGAAGNLQRAGLIRYSRGYIEVLDRIGLEKEACECYGVVKLEFNRLLPDNPKRESNYGFRHFDA